MVLDIFLATALIAGNASCKQPSDDSGYEIDDDTQNPQGGQQGGDQQTEWQQPDYMNVTEEFGGQRFVAAGASWFYDKQDVKDQKFTAHYNDANQYINGKVAELQKLWQGKDTGSDLSNQIGTALRNFNTNTSVTDNITNNYTALAPVFADIENEFIKKDEAVDYHRFNACYHKLAHNAYNNSKGNYTSIRCPSNTEMDNSKNYFNYELADANLSYNELTVEKAKEIMYNALTDVAQRTDTEVEVLKKAVELALYNESLYGLHDFAQINKVNITDALSQRSLLAFENKITQCIRNKTQSIDDRTM